VGSTAPQVGYTPGEIFRDFNDQRAKIEFSSQKAEAAAPNVARPADPSLLPYTIFAGTIIPAALETAINTDLPGDVLATVAENVYDSVSGKNLLIPQGSRLLAKYSSNISFGQNRVQVAWQRLIRPDGVSLQLANMNGVDPQGMSGYTGHVDEHWWQYAKGIGLMVLFSIIDGQLQYSMKQANTQGAADVANSLTAGIDQVGTQFTANAMNVQPTITVNQGAKVQVFVNSDIIMPPANQKPVSKKYTLQKEQGGTQ
jgi:type IV secretion system protein VirB10